MAGNSINIPAYGAASWKAPVANAAALPTAGNSDGDVRALLDSELLYIWDGSAWILLVSPGATPPGGSNTQVQFNNSGAFAGSAGLTFNSGTNALTVSGAVSASNLSGTNTGDVTLTAVGSSPSANGASLSGQALTLQPADSTHPGVLTAADWSTFNAKQAPNFIGSLSTVIITEDFIVGAAQGSTNWTPSANSGAVAQHNGATFAQLNPGVIELRTSTSSSAAPSLNLGVNIFQAGGGAMSVEGVARLDALSDGTDTYTARLGFGDSTTGTAPTDGMWLEYTHSVNSGNWTFNTASSTTTTTSNGSIAAVAGAWFRFKITCNADGTSASGFINDVLVNTNTTNIPSGAGRSFGIQFSLTKSLGSTQRILYIDWAQIIQNLTTSR